MQTVLEVLSYDFDVLENIKHRCREWTYSEGVRMWDDSGWDEGRGGKLGKERMYT